MKLIITLYCPICIGLPVKMLLRSTHDKDVFQTECPNCNSILLYTPDAVNKSPVQLVKQGN